ncbi:hypothetical protein GF352_01000 [archaeon]|nr:hypothetical protein [archaeon]
MRRWFFFLITTLLLTPGLAALSDDLSTVSGYVDSYNIGEITASELIVYVDYVKNQMYKDDLITESEVADAFGSTDNPELVFNTTDFSLVFFADYQVTEEFLESREGTASYHVGYYLMPLEPSFSGLSSELQSFIQGLTELINSDGEVTTDLKSEWRGLKFKVNNLEGDCNDLMNSVLGNPEEHYDGVGYHKVIAETYEENCREEQNCTQVCDEGGCYPECTPMTVCDNWTDGEVKIKGWCDNEGYASLSFEAWGDELERFIEVNNLDEMSGFSQYWIKSLVRLRKPFQESFNDDFVEWYFEDYLGSDIEKLMYGGDAVSRILNVLVWVEEDIVEALGRSGNKSWPAGFEEISIDYNKSNVRLEVWEKYVPVDWFDNNKAWTTLYRYHFFPAKDSLKELILYQVSQENTIGLSASQIAEIKADSNRMELVNNIAGRYGGSFDINLRLFSGEEDLINKYLSINPEEVISFSDEAVSADISISVNYDSLYKLLSYIATMQSSTINGPGWVNLDQGGPSFGQVMGVIGALSKFWREGVAITPRHALLTLLFNVLDMFNLAQGLGSLGEVKVSTS